MPFNFGEGGNNPFMPRGGGGGGFVPPQPIPTVPPGGVQPINSGGWPSPAGGTAGASRPPAPAGGYPWQQFIGPGGIANDPSNPGARWNDLASIYMQIDPSMRNQFFSAYPNFEAPGPGWQNNWRSSQGGGHRGGGGGGGGGGHRGGGFDGAIPFADPFGGSLSDTTRLDEVLQAYLPAFQERMRGWINDSQAQAGFMGNRYSSYAMESAADQAERAALEVQALFQPLMFENIQNNLRLAEGTAGYELGKYDRLFNTAQYEQDRVDRFAMANDPWSRLLDILNLSRPGQSFPVMNTDASTGFSDYLDLYLRASDLF